MRAVRYYDNDAGVVLELYVHSTGIEISMEDKDNSILMSIDLGDLSSLSDDIFSMLRVLKDFNKKPSE